MEQFGHVIDGREESDGATFDSVDPWTREPWATVALGGASYALFARALGVGELDEAMGLVLRRFRRSS